eukprot:7376837-Prymnesium_polylepis.1
MRPQGRERRGCARSLCVRGSPSAGRQRPSSRPPRARALAARTPRAHLLLRGRHLLERLGRHALALLHVRNLLARADRLRVLVLEALVQLDQLLLELAQVAVEARLLLLPRLDALLGGRVPVGRQLRLVPRLLQLVVRAAHRALNAVESQQVEALLELLAPLLQLRVPLRLLLLLLHRLALLPHERERERERCMLNVHAHAAAARAARCRRASRAATLVPHTPS